MSLGSWRRVKPVVGITSFSSQLVAGRQRSCYQLLATGDQLVCTADACIRNARPGTSRRTGQAHPRARAAARGLAGRALRAAALQGARAEGTPQVPAGVLPDRRMGVSRHAARPGHPVLPRRSEPRKARARDRRPRGQPRDHALHAARGRARVQLRVPPLRARRLAWRCSVRSIGPIATSTGRSRSAATTCATWKAGTRRSIPTRTSPRRSRSG